MVLPEQTAINGYRQTDADCKQNRLCPLNWTKIQSKYFSTLSVRLSIDIPVYFSQVSLHLSSQSMTMRITLFHDEVRATSSRGERSRGRFRLCRYAEGSTSRRFFSSQNKQFQTLSL